MGNQAGNLTVHSSGLCRLRGPSDCARVAMTDETATCVLAARTEKNHRLNLRLVQPELSMIRSCEAARMRPRRLRLGASGSILHGDAPVRSQIRFDHLVDQFKVRRMRCVHLTRQQRTLSSAAAMMPKR